MYSLFVLLLCILTLPFQVALAVLIVLADGFPVLFAQKRVGKDGKIFWMYKFRSMLRDAERLQEKLRTHNEAHGPVFKIHNDPRYTRVGKFLAHTGLDELPQLYNVLGGDMALFGPRPLPVSEVAHLKSWQEKRHMIKPGIISPWIFQGYHKQSFDAWMKSDIAYMKAKSPTYDAKLALQAVRLLWTLMRREFFER